MYKVITVVWFWILFSLTLVRSCHKPVAVFLFLFWAVVGSRIISKVQMLLPTARSPLHWRDCILVCIKPFVCATFVLAIKIVPSVVSFSTQFQLSSSYLWTGEKVRVSFKYINSFLVLFYSKLSFFLSRMKFRI